MPRCLPVLAFFAMVAGPAPALTFEACTKAEMGRLGSAVAGAVGMAAAAAAAVRDDDLYRTWFGRYSSRRADEVRARLKSVHAALVRDTAEFACVNEGIDGCKDGTFAYVYRDEPYRVYVCSRFHHLPAMFEVARLAPEMEHGTREGTMIHEMSHFVIVAGTEDSCYTRSVCRDMAAADPFSAILNADSFQYFAEDAAFLSPPVSHPGVKTGRARR